MVAWASVMPTGAAFAGEEPKSPEGIPRNQEEKIRGAAPEKASVVPARPRRVLIFNTPAHLMDKDPHKGYCIPYGAAAMRILGEKTGAFEPVVSDDLAQFAPDAIKRFDAIVLNNAGGAWIAPSDAALPKLKALGATKEAVEQALRKSLLDYVSNGGGLVAYHYAASANRDWPQFRDLLGATFTGHPWNEEVAVLVEEPDHPLVAAFGGKNFRVADEIFEFGPPFDRANVRVLLSLDTERTNMGVKWINRKDNDFAHAWVKAYGKGRVFYTGFGHRTEMYWNLAILRFYLDAIQFATGDLKAPTEPRATRPTHKAPGPTLPEVRGVKMFEKKIAMPTAGQIQKIEDAAPDSAPAKPAKERRILVWGHSWAHEPNPFAEKAIEILGRKTGAFEAVVSDDPRSLLGDALPRFDALVMNNIHEPEPFLPENYASLDPEQKAAADQFDAAVKQSILEYVRGGRGVVGIHAATAALGKWKEYGEMMGGFYGGHIFEEVPIKLDDPKHPINAAFEGKPFTIRDEIYIMREPHSPANLRILASLDLGRMKDPGKRPDRIYAVSWVRPYEKGRVFYTTLGHAPETYWNPLFLKHLLAGIQFAIGDLEGPTAPLKQ
jgi:hypothetical protein